MTRTLHRAQFVLNPGLPPIADGAVLVESGRILGTGRFQDVLASDPGLPVEDHGPSVLLPGLVNAHTHLSITGLEAETDAADPFLSWLDSIARQARGLDGEAARARVAQGIALSLEQGTALLGEVTTRAEGVDLLLEAPVAARVYFEFLGDSARDAPERFEVAALAARRCDVPPSHRARPGLSPHAPYSVWPDLWSEADRTCREAGWLWSSHLLEPPHEREFLERGTGPLREYLERLGVWDGSFPVPGTGPVTLLQEAGVLSPRALLVHGVHLTAGDLGTLAAAGAEICLCPRSNARLGLPPAPVRAVLEAGIRPCLGTDGLPSNEDLGIWGEMRALADLLPGLDDREILVMATRNGARALGFADRLGSLDPGREARLLAVPLEPADLDGVKRMLVREGKFRPRTRLGW